MNDKNTGYKDWDGNAIFEDSILYMESTNQTGIVYAARDNYYVDFDAIFEKDGLLADLLKCPLMNLKIMQESEGHKRSPYETLTRKPIFENDVIFLPSLGGNAQIYYMPNYPDPKDRWKAIVPTSDTEGQSYNLEECDVCHAPSRPRLQLVTTRKPEAGKLEQTNVNGFKYQHHTFDVQLPITPEDGPIKLSIDDNVVNSVQSLIIRAGQDGLTNVTFETAAEQIVKCIGILFARIAESPALHGTLMDIHDNVEADVSEFRKANGIPQSDEIDEVLAYRIKRTLEIAIDLL